MSAHDAPAERPRRRHPPTVPTDPGHAHEARSAYDPVWRARCPRTRPRVRPPSPDRKEPGQLRSCRRYIRPPADDHIRPTDAPPRTHVQAEAAVTDAGW